MYDLFLLSSSILDLNLDQFEYEIFCADIVEGNLIRSRFKRPDSFKCRFLGCQRVVGEQGCHDLDVGLSFSVAGQRHFLRVFIRFYGTVLLDHDLRRVLLEVVGNGGIDQVGHFLRRGVIICAHRIADVSESVAGEGVFDIILLVLHFFARAGALGDQLAVGVHLMFCSLLHHHEFDGVGHEAGAALGFIVEGQGCIGRQGVPRNRYPLLVARRGRRRTVLGQINAHRVIAVDVRRLDRHALVLLEEVFGLIIGGRLQVALGAADGGFADQLDRDGLLGAVQFILECHGVIVRIAVGDDILGRICTRLDLVSVQCRCHYRQCHILDRRKRIAMEHLVIILAVHRHSGVAVCLLLPIQEDDLRVRVAHGVARGIELFGRVVAVHSGDLCRVEGVGLAGGHIVDLLRCACDRLFAVHILLHDRQLVLVAGVGVGDGHIVLAVVLAVRRSVFHVARTVQRVVRDGEQTGSLSLGGVDGPAIVDLLGLGGQHPAVRVHGLIGHIALGLEVVECDRIILGNSINGAVRGDRALGVVPGDVRLGIGEARPDLCGDRDVVEHLGRRVLQIAVDGHIGHVVLIEELHRADLILRRRAMDLRQSHHIGVIALVILDEHGRLTVDANAHQLVARPGAGLDVVLGDEGRIGPLAGVQRLGIGIHRAVLILHPAIDGDQRQLRVLRAVLQRILAVVLLVADRIAVLIGGKEGPVHGLVIKQIGLREAVMGAQRRSIVGKLRAHGIELHMIKAVVGSGQQSARADIGSIVAVQIPSKADLLGAGVSLTVQQRTIGAVALGLGLDQLFGTVGAADRFPPFRAELDVEGPEDVIHGQPLDQLHFHAVGLILDLHPIAAILVDG